MLKWYLTSQKPVLAYLVVTGSYLIFRDCNSRHKAIAEIWRPEPEAETTRMKAACE